MRMVLARWKFAYLAGGHAAQWAIARLTDPLPLPLSYGVDYILWIAYILVAVRSFRGRNEPLEPPRPWWRMTAKPTAGFNLGALFVLSAVSFALPQIADRFGGYAIGYTIEFAAFALLFFHSSLQLNRRGTARAEAQASSDEWRPGPLPRALR